MFSLYTTPLSNVIRMHPKIKLHLYTDDTQFTCLTKMQRLAFDKLNFCLPDVEECMLSSMLKLNPDKTEFIIF